MTAHALDLAALPPTIAFQNAGLMQALAAGPYATAGALAEAAGVVQGNLNRKLDALRFVDLVDTSAGTPAAKLTPAGVTALEAIRRAAGQGASAATGELLLRIPHGDLTPNPDNPRKTFDKDLLQGMADTIAEKGDVLEPLLVSAPLVNGQRMILAGHRRWLATGLALAEHPLIGAAIREEGLPCIESVGDEGDALFIAVVENSQREGLSPWEDALALAALADKKGWSARELALRIGRRKDGSEGGLRDVQTKIKVVREATAEAIAQYQQDGNWERLRNSVADGKPKTEAKAPAAKPEAPLSRAQIKEAAIGAIMESLPDTEAELLEAGAVARRGYHRAVMAMDAPRAEKLELVYEAAALKMNGGANFASADARAKLDAYCAQVPGKIPEWGQCGEFLVTVGDMPVVVRIKHPLGASYTSVEYWVADVDKPFLSSTGFRSDTGAPEAVGGVTVDEATRGRLEWLVTQKGSKPALIDAEYRQRRQPLQEFPWLFDAAPEPTLPIEPPPARAADGDAVELTPGEELVLVEIAHASQDQPSTPSRIVQYVTVGAYYQDQRANTLQQKRLIVFRHPPHESPQVALTGEGMALLEARGFNLPLSLPALTSYQTNSVDKADALTDVYATPWLNVSADAPAAEIDAAEQPPLIDEDRLARDAREAEDAETLDMVDALVDEWTETEIVRGEQLAAILNRLGLTLPLSAGEGEEAGEILYPDGSNLGVVDVNNEGSNGRAQAIAGIVALAVNVLCKDLGAAAPESDDDTLEIPGFLRRLAGGGR